MSQEQSPDLPDLPERYEVLEKIGCGGMGSIYKVLDTALGKVVAVKVLADDVSLDPSSVQRFQREAQSAGSLSHEHLVTVMDFGITTSRRPYLVMEYVQGPTLRDLVRRSGRLEPDDCLSIALEIADGMTYAHSKGVVHRDLKSENIIVLTEPSGPARIKVVDFGIARRVAPDGTSGGGLTITNAILGSPLYMSPEQVRGETADERSDVYSLGCIIFECLTGAPPFQGDTAVDTMIMHIEKATPSLGREHPESLAALVDRMLSKAPEDRYQSMEDLARALRACREELERQREAEDGEAGTVEAQSSRIPKGIISRQRLVVAFSIGGILILAACVLMSSMGAFKSRAPSQPSEKPVDTQALVGADMGDDETIRNLLTSAHEAAAERDFFRTAYHLQQAYKMDSRNKLVLEETRRQLEFIDRHYPVDAVESSVRELTVEIRRNERLKDQRGMMYFCLGEYSQSFQDLSDYLKMDVARRRRLYACETAQLAFLAGKHCQREKEGRKLLEHWRRYAGKSQSQAFRLMLDEMSVDDYLNTVNSMLASQKQRELSILERKMICQKLAMCGLLLDADGDEKRAIDVLIFPAVAADPSTVEKVASIFEIRRLWKKHYPEWQQESY